MKTVCPTLSQILYSMPDRYRALLRIMTGMDKSLETSPYTGDLSHHLLGFTFKALLEMRSKTQKILRLFATQGLQNRPCHQDINIQ